MSYKIIVDGASLKFSSAHFIVGHEKCGRIHGHNFLVSVSISTPALNEKYFVMDFIDVKKHIRNIISSLDHKLLVPSNATNLKLQENEENIKIEYQGKRYSLPLSDVCMLPLPAITSEMLARYFYDSLVLILRKSINNFSLKVKIGETPSSFAEYGE